MNLDPQILIVRHMALGDVILTTPIIEQIYTNYRGNCHIDVLTHRTEVFKNNPHIRKAFKPQEFQANTTAYDKVINLDLAYEKQPKMHITDAYALYALGSPDLLSLKRPMLYSDMDDEIYASWLKKTIIQGEYAVIHMRSDNFWPSRNLPATFWKDIVDSLLAHTHIKVVQVGAHDEIAFSHDERLIDLRGRLSIHQLKELIGAALLYVGIDSGTLHIAATTDTPVVSMFSSAHHALRMPLGRPEHASFNAIQPAVPCYGCQSTIKPPITNVTCTQGDPQSPPCISKFSLVEIQEKISLAIQAV